MKRRPTLVHVPDLAAVAAVCALLGGCGTQSGTAEIEQPAASATTETENAAPPSPPKSYRFVLSSSCGERGLIGDYGVTVRNERVTEVENLNVGYPHQPRLTEIPTLSDLTAMAESAPAQAIVEFVVDDEGLPRSLSLDPVPNAIDDEECYKVSNLERLP